MNNQRANQPATSEKTCAVYQIVHRKTGKRYIGASTYIERHISEQLARLRNGNHHNAALQADYNDDPTLSAAIIATIDDPIDLSTEKRYWLIRLKPEYNGFPHPTGAHSNRAKLTADAVREIRHRYDTKELTMTTLANEYNTSVSNISAIVHRKSWRHV